jgi:hypothetical protein
MRPESPVTPFTVMTFISAFTGVMVLSPRGEAFRRRMVKALEKSGIRGKEAALTMQLTPQRTSEALAGRSPLSIYRVFELDDPFWDEFCDQIVAANGGTVVRDARIARLLNDVELVMARAELKPLEFKSVTLPLIGEKVSA